MCSLWEKCSLNVRYMRMFAPKKNSRNDSRSKDAQLLDEIALAGRRLDNMTSSPEVPNRIYWDKFLRDLYGFKISSFSYSTLIFEPYGDNYFCRDLSFALQNSHPLFEN